MTDSIIGAKTFLFVSWTFLWEDAVDLWCPAHQQMLQMCLREYFMVQGRSWIVPGGGVETRQSFSLLIPSSRRSCCKTSKSRINGCDGNSRAEGKHPPLSSHLSRPGKSGSVIGQPPHVGEGVAHSRRSPEQKEKELRATTAK